MSTGEAWILWLGGTDGLFYSGTFECLLISFFLLVLSKKTNLSFTRSLTLTIDQMWQLSQLSNCNAKRHRRNRLSSNTTLNITIEKNTTLNIIIEKHYIEYFYFLLLSFYFYLLFECPWFLVVFAPCLPQSITQFTRKWIDCHDCPASTDVCVIAHFTDFLA